MERQSVLRVIRDEQEQAEKAWKETHMAKKVSSRQHKSMTRERVRSAQRPTSARSERRAEQREARKAMAATVQHDPRAVKFNPTRV